MNVYSGKDNYTKDTIFLFIEILSVSGKHRVGVKVLVRVYCRC